MAKKKFTTDRQVAALVPLPGQRQTEYSHGSQPGLVLRVGRQKKTWAVNYVVDGKRRKITIGQYPAMPLAEAVDKARQIRADAARGLDPLGKKLAKRDSWTVNDVMLYYLTVIARKRNMAQSTLKESWRIFHKDIENTLGHIKALDLRKGDISGLHDSVSERGGVIANRVVELLRRAIRAADVAGKISVKVNLFSGLSNIKAEERPRNRVLEDDEIRELWQAMEFESPNMRDVLRLILLTAQRPGEVMGMTVEEIDTAKRLWIIPVDRIKTRRKIQRDHVVPLSPQAWAIIEPRLNNERWVFPSAYNRTRPGATSENHTKTPKDARKRLQAMTGITDWTAHDLRRTARTIMTRNFYKKNRDGEMARDKDGRFILESKGAPIFIAERILNHAVGEIEATYDINDYIEEMRDALHLLGDRIDKIVGAEKKSAKVIPLRRATHG